MTLSVTATGSPAPTYQWFVNGSPIYGQTASSISLGPVQASSSGTYTVTATNSSGSITSSGATLTVSTVVVPSIGTQPLSQGVAPGTGVTFSVSAAGTGPLGYQWNFNNAPIAGAVSTSYSISAAQASDSGSYTVTVTGPDTSVVSQGAVLTVSGSSGAPALGTQPQPQTVQLGSTVTFSVDVGRIRHVLRRGPGFRDHDLPVAAQQHRNQRSERADPCLEGRLGGRCRDLQLPPRQQLGGDPVRVRGAHGGERPEPGPPGRHLMPRARGNGRRHPHRRIHGGRGKLGLVARAGQVVGTGPGPVQCRGAAARPDARTLLSLGHGRAA